MTRSYKVKNKLLLLGVVLLGALAYWLSISKTVVLYRENSRLEAKLDSLENAPSAIARLTAQLQQYEKSLSHFSTRDKNWEERLLHGLAQVCQRHHVKLLHIPVPQTEEQSNYVIHTRAVKMEGGYLNLVQVLYDLEHTKALGRITAVRFALEKDRKTRKTFLFAYIYIQHIEKGGSRET